MSDEDDFWVTTRLQVKCDAAIGGVRLRIDATLKDHATALFGPSGSGKSSLLRLIAGLWRPAGSEVWLNGANLTHVPTHERRIALVAQEPALFPHLSVQENIRFGIGQHSKAGALDMMLDIFQLRALADARIGTLSGGERKRVAIARALAGRPRLLLLDEVFTGMHRAQRNDLMLRVRIHCEQRWIGILSVTHDPTEALTLNNETLTMDDGRITAQGPTCDVLKSDLFELHTLGVTRAGTDAQNIPSYNVGAVPYNPPQT